MVTSGNLFAALDELVAMARAANEEYEATDDIEQLEKDLDKLAERAYGVSGQVAIAREALIELGKLAG